MKPRLKQQNFLYNTSQLMVMEQKDERTKKTQMVSVVFLILVAMMFFTYSNATITGYSTFSTVFSGQSFYPLTMGFISLLGAMLVYGLMRLT